MSPYRWTPTDELWDFAYAYCLTLYKKSERNAPIRSLTAQAFLVDDTSRLHCTLRQILNSIIFVLMLCELVFFLCLGTLRVIYVLLHKSTHKILFFSSEKNGVSRISFAIYRRGGLAWNTLIRFRLERNGCCVWEGPCNFGVTWLILYIATLSDIRATFNMKK